MGWGGGVQVRNITLHTVPLGYVMLHYVPLPLPYPPLEVQLLPSIEAPHNFLETLNFFKVLNFSLTLEFLVAIPL